MNPLKNKKFEMVRRNLALPSFSKKSAETRAAFVAKLKVLSGEDVSFTDAGMAPKDPSSIGTRPVYVPPNTTPTRVGALDHLNHKRVGYPT